MFEESDSYYSVAVSLPTRCVEEHISNLVQLIWRQLAHPNTPLAKSHQPCPVILISLLVGSLVAVPRFEDTVGAEDI
jgi:hypothetical protein